MIILESCMQGNLVMAMGRDYSKYYTPITISKALLKLIGFNNNCSVVDICCGSGNLLETAREENPTLICTGVDVADVSVNNITFFKMDGRAYALKHPKSFDYALANPPFGRVIEEKYANRLFLGDYKGINSSRIEVEMLIANLISLKPNGILLAILPTTFIKGPSSIITRKKLATAHTVQSIIDLPNNAFSPEKIKCSAIIVKKEKNTLNTPTSVYSMDNKYVIHYGSKISSEQINTGVWGENNCPSSHPLSIRQGSVSTSCFSNNGSIEVLHTSKRDDNWTPSVKHIEKLPTNQNIITAEDGDIIISRVGASAGQKCIYHGLPKLVSDCLLVVKNLTEEEKTLFLAQDLCAIVCGLSTPHITINSINNLYSSAINT